MAVLIASGSFAYTTVIRVLLVVQQVIQRVLAFAFEERAELHIATDSEVPTVTLLDRSYMRVGAFAAKRAPLIP